jgi:Fic family protein
MKPFIPLELPFKEEINPLLFINELVDANTNVGKYQILIKNSKINSDFLINPLLLQEAVQSTKIEGTQATLDQVLESEMEDKKPNNDIQEVLNYYDALKYGENALNRIPISTRFFKEMHTILLSKGVRGENRSPGEYRSIQNFIGPKGCTMETASFVPPEPHLVDKYMSNLEKYINEPIDDLHPLIRIAIIHAQFETINSFLDGNGRIGRILIPLYLYEQNIIDAPNFFISEALEKNKHKYYRLLNDTRLKSNWNEWIKFFLESVDNQAKKNLKLIQDINDLYETDLETVIELVSSNNIVKLINVMYKHPIFNVKLISSLTGIPDVTCRRYLSILEENNMIYSDDKKRDKKYYYYNLLDLLR